MPTENRSSNTEMVSVPRHTLENVLNDGSCKAEVHAAFIQARNDIERLLAQPAEQHQGEPVAVLYADGTVLTKTDCGDGFEICCKVETPLYTHADPGEVELIGWKERCRKLNDESMDWMRKYDALRTQLAERDAQFTAMKQIALDACADLYPQQRRRVEGRIAALSASAEPSARESKALEDEKRLGIERLPAEPSAPVEIDEQSPGVCKGANCTSDGKTPHSTECRFEHARAVASGIKSVTIEIDERAEFELAYQRAVDHGWSNVKHLARQLWEARAALERKP